MPLSIRTGISNQTAGTSKSSSASSIPQTPSLQVGKVMGVVTTNNTPTRAQFEKLGGYSSSGTIFYLDYDKSKNIDPKLNDDIFLDRYDFILVMLGTILPITFPIDFTNGDTTYVHIDLKFLKMYSKKPVNVLNFIFLASFSRIAPSALAKPAVATQIKSTIKNNQFGSPTSAHFFIS